MLVNIINLWDELLMTGIALYIATFIFFMCTYLATESRHLIIGAILALITGFLSQISEIITKTGIVLTFIRLILFFI